MKNTIKLWFGMLVLVLAFGMAVAGCGAQGGGSSALAGKWIYESGVTYNKPEDLELLKDGTGVCDGLSITWKVENRRFIISSALLGMACDYKISGSKLTLFYDDGSSATFIKSK
jgi:hypothetical protein